MSAFSCKGRGVCPSCNTRRMGQKRPHTWWMTCFHKSRCANGGIVFSQTAEVFPEP
ncbi:MAG: hypothetical protein ACRERU_06230 [Methylococcales bacterium]